MIMENGSERVEAMRLIDADELSKEGFHLERVYQNDAQSMILETKYLEDVPTVDAVPVVRCGECKHYRDGDQEHPDCGYCKRLICGTVVPDYYCADGERKDDESEN